VLAASTSGGQGKGDPFPGCGGGGRRGPDLVVARRRIQPGLLFVVLGHRQSSSVWSSLFLPPPVGREDDMAAAPSLGLGMTAGEERPRGEITEESKEEQEKC
jgi:hypothetical protein